MGSMTVMWTYEDAPWCHPRTYANIHLSRTSEERQGLLQGQYSIAERFNSVTIDLGNCDSAPLEDLDAIHHCNLRPIGVGVTAIRALHVVLFNPPYPKTEDEKSRGQIESIARRLRRTRGGRSRIAYYVDEGELIAVSCRINLTGVC